MTATRGFVDAGESARNKLPEMAVIHDVTAAASLKRRHGDIAAADPERIRSVTTAVSLKFLWY